MKTKKHLFIALGVVAIILAALCVTRCKPKPQETTVNLRLQWFPQAQFAGYLVAQQKGFYQEEGIKVNILPAGPDLKPQTTVASGADQIGIGVSNQIISAQANGVPLVTIAQIFQESPNKYVLKKENQITTLSELKGKKVGLWLGGDEAEFISMLKTAGMTLKDVEVVPQGFTVTPFLEGEYVLSQVTSYNELQQVIAALSEDNLQILSPGDYNSGIPADNIFTTRKFIDENPAVIEKFLRASIKGWKYAIEHPEETVEIILSFNKELNKEEQEASLNEVLKMVTAGKAREKGIGYMSKDEYENVERILLQSGQISKEVDIAKTFDESIWRKIRQDSN